MYRSLLSQNLFGAVHPTRLRHLRQYVCLREATDSKAAAEYLAAFQQLAAKHQVSVQELTQMHSVLQLKQLDVKANFQTEEQYRAHRQELELLIRQTPYSLQGIEKAAQSISLRVPELLSLSSDIRTTAAKELGQIYLLKDVHGSVQRHYDQQLDEVFTERTEARIRQLRSEVKDKELLASLENCLNNVLNQYRSVGGRYLGLIQSFVDAAEGRKTEVPATTEAASPQQLRAKQESKIQAKYGKLSQEDMEYALDVDAHDFKAFLQEVYEKEYTSGMAQNRFNEKGQKLVYEAQPPSTAALRYQILAAVFGGLFLYLFYKGDSYYSTIVTVPAIAAGCFYAAKHHSALGGLSFIRQILRNQDGSLELVFQQNSTIQRIENVAASQVKLNMKAQPAHQLLFGRPTDYGYHLNINGNSFIAPYQYNGNSLDFRRALSL